MRVRVASAADIPAMIELERQCDTAAHWTEGQYRAALPACGAALTARLMLVAGHDEQGKAGSQRQSSLGGFLVARHLGLEWELENIVVDPALRRKGLGARLMEEFLSRAQAVGSEDIFLEVRETNQTARAFYEKYGFEETRRRRGYYSNPQEDAVVYQRTLSRAK